MMSDYQDFCESYGGCASDPCFMDEWIGNFCGGNLTKIQEIPEDILTKGKLVHIIELTNEQPAKAVGVIWNKKLEYDVSLKQAKRLTGERKTDAANWLVSQGYRVYSKKENDRWYQVAFKENDKDTLVYEKFQKEYESMCPFLDGNRTKNLV